MSSVEYKKINFCPLLRDRNLSCAIFAPGWTYELPHRENNVDKEFMKREYLFWEKLKPFLNYQALNLDLDTRGEFGASRSGEKLRLVFRSCFSSGRGNQWFHLLSLQPQPSLISTNIQENNYFNRQIKFIWLRRNKYIFF